MKEEEWINSIINDPHSIWDTPAKYWSYVRQCLRRASMRNPLKTKWKNAQLHPVTEKEKKENKFHPSTKKAGTCEICKKLFPGSKLQVDHITPASCKDRATAQEFMFHCLGTTTDQYQLLCNPCHKIKTLADNKEITFEEAKIEKEVIEIAKLPTKKQKEWISKKGLKPESNAKKRREQIKQIKTNEKA